VLSMEKPKGLEVVASSSPISVRDLDIVGAGFCGGLLRRAARCRSVRLGPRIVKRWSHLEFLDPIDSSIVHQKKMTRARSARAETTMVTARMTTA
jgi:hypothetical protein